MHTLSLKEKMRSPRFSIVIPSYNRREYVGLAIDSVLSQTFADFEVVVLDDGSTDGAIEVIKSYGQRIKLISQENHGAEAARSRGVAAACGEYVVLLDDDDMLFPTTLATYDRVIRILKEPPVILGAVVPIYDRAALPPSDGDGTIEYLHFADYLSRDVPVSLTCSQLVVKRSVALGTGAFRPERTAFPFDIPDMMLRLGTSGPFIILRRPSTVAYRQHSSNIVKAVDSMIESSSCLARLERGGGVSRRRSPPVRSLRLHRHDGAVLGLQSCGTPSLPNRAQTPDRLCSHDPGRPHQTVLAALPHPYPTVPFAAGYFGIHKKRTCTMRELPQGYRPIGSMSTERNGIDVWHSTEASDPLWDDFLRNAPCGQYQQSSLWAEFKKEEGWEHYRIVITSASIITGGYQLLWKRKGPIRIGYVNKGPVLQPETPVIVIELIRLLVDTARELRLNALILQQPDETSVGIDPFTDAGFVVSNPMNMIESTCLVDLHHDSETLQRKMSSSLRGNLRTAKKLPVMIRNGTENDLGTFFSLMKATCLRQHTMPNPASETALGRLWEIFSSKGMIRLTLAECEGQVPAALISLGFGDRLTAWKKGWNGGQRQWHPNELLQYESMEWAKGMEYGVYDFSSFRRAGAERILGGVPADNLELSARDEYHRRFGGRPKLLPRALLLIPNRPLRWLYRKTFVRFEHQRKQRLYIERT